MFPDSTFYVSYYENYLFEIFIFYYIWDREDILVAPGGGEIALLLNNKYISHVEKKECLTFT